MADRALVLGGGGVTGVAWELGILAGLAEAGVDLTHPDTLVGTSAGSAVGAIIAGGVLRERYQAQLRGPGGEIPERLGMGLLARYGWALVRSNSLQQFGARMGAMALAAVTISPAERKAVLESRIGVADGWPEQFDLKVTAVDAMSGEFVVFDRDSGVALIDAVAASCAVPGVWPPAEIDRRRYIDGGMRSAVNADLVTGTPKVVVLAPIARGGGLLASPARQVAALRAQGSQVVLVSPDLKALRAIGTNVLDPARRRPAAEAGFAQAKAEAAAIAEVWNGS
jgi:NTE family protein